MRSVENREISIPVGIVVEKRKSTHPWADWNWIPRAVFMNAEEGVNWREMMRGDDFVQYHAATLHLNLHRKDTEALRLNLMLEKPELYVVLRDSEEAGSEFPWQPFLVTASS